MKIIQIIFSKAPKQKHDYDVTNLLGYNDSKSAARFITGGKVFYFNYTLIVRNCEYNWSTK